MGRSIGFDHVSGTSTSFVWDLNEAAERVQQDEWGIVGPGTIQILLVGGGGGAGSGNYSGGGGGGGFVVASAVAVDVGRTYIISVGEGGAVNTDGGNSVFKDSAETINIVAYGGGGGGSGYGQNGRPGASGGGGTGNNPPGPFGVGGSATTFPGAFDTVQGNPGGGGHNQYRCGSGGGAGSPGSPTSKDATPGANNNFQTGSNIAYAGGGGGKSGPGDLGSTAPGGGGVGKGNAPPGTAGTDGLGGGGGKEMPGGSGIVILRYPDVTGDIVHVSGTSVKRTYTGFKSFTFSSSVEIQFV